MARKKSPYPSLGTPLGDVIVGNCRGEGCGAPVRRGERFTTLLGDVLVCETCNVSGAKIREKLDIKLEDTAMT